MTAHQMVFTVCLASAMFLFGLYIGEEQSAAKLQPCPQAGKAELISATVTGQICTYAEIVRDGKKFKWEVRKI